MRTESGRDSNASYAGVGTVKDGELGGELRCSSGGRAGMPERARRRGCPERIAETIDERSNAKISVERDKLIFKEEKGVPRSTREKA